MKRRFYERGALSRNLEISSEEVESIVDMLDYSGLDDPGTCYRLTATYKILFTSKGVVNDPVNDPKILEQKILSQLRTQISLLKTFFEQCVLKLFFAPDILRFELLVLSLIAALTPFEQDRAMIKVQLVMDVKNNTQKSTKDVVAKVLEVSGLNNYNLIRTASKFQPLGEQTDIEFKTLFQKVIKSNSQFCAFLETYKGVEAKSGKVGKKQDPLYPVFKAIAKSLFDIKEIPTRLQKVLLILMIWRLPTLPINAACRYSLNLIDQMEVEGFKLTKSEVYCTKLASVLVNLLKELRTNSLMTPTDIPRMNFF